MHSLIWTVEFEFTYKYNTLFSRKCLPKVLDPTWRHEQTSLSQCLTMSYNRLYSPTTHCSIKTVQNASKHFGYSTVSFNNNLFTFCVLNFRLVIWSNLKSSWGIIQVFWQYLRCVPGFNLWSVVVIRLPYNTTHFFVAYIYTIVTWLIQLNTLYIQKARWESASLHFVVHVLSFKKNISSIISSNHWVFYKNGLIYYAVLFFYIRSISY